MIVSLTVTAKTTLSCAFVLLPIPVAVLAFVAASPLSSAWRAALYLQGAASVVQAMAYACFLVHKRAIPACLASAFVAWLAGLVYYTKVVRDAVGGSESFVLTHHPAVATAHFTLWGIVAALAGAYSLYVLVSQHTSIIAGIEDGLSPSAKSSPSTISVHQFKVDPGMDLNTSSTVARSGFRSQAVHAQEQINSVGSQNVIGTNSNATNTTTQEHSTPLLPSLEPEAEEGPDLPTIVVGSSLEGLEAIPASAGSTTSTIQPKSRHTHSTSSFGSINFAGLNIRSPPSSKFIHPSLQIRHNGRRMDRLRHSIDELSDGHVRGDSAGKFDTTELAGPRRESGDFPAPSTHRYSTELHSVFSAATSATELTVKSPPEVYNHLAPVARPCTPPAPCSPTKSSHGSVYTSAHTSLNSSPTKSPRKSGRLSRLGRLSLSLEGLNDISPKKLRKSRSDCLPTSSGHDDTTETVTTPQPDEFNQWEIQDVAWNLRNVSGSSADTGGTHPDGQRVASTASSGVNIITSRGFVRDEVI
ncbi:hypothetical protein CJU90_2868 [Yarrowia sp. C11]|nr:hypothetical protein CKK34_4315 [Yarrowia sp. E02]KAG5369416.1 hypothetical protein CJU90_2868 [Yarrowia sp. C11]